jgi:NAD(P)-dependent dehydrogenase (short-subunit alcohol dehydrogenase family)
VTDTRRPAFDDLAGRTALVTGGARGIGLAIARGLAAHGVSVALLALRPDVHRSAEQLATDYGVATVGLECDVADSAAVDRAFIELTSRLGTPGILVNSAGIAVNAPAVDMTDDQWQRVLDVNLTGTFNTCRAFARHRETRDTANIINISSMSARIVNIPQQQCVYNVAKAGVDMLTKCLAVEWLPHGIRVNAIAPGYILTDLTRDYSARNPELAEFWRSRIPTGEMGDPADLVDVALLLASSAARYMVGETVVVDGGYSIV